MAAGTAIDLHGEESRAAGGRPAGAERAGEEKQAPPGPEEHHFRDALVAVALVFGLGILTAAVSITLYALGGPNKAEVLGTLALLGSAACVAGAFFGFLFGVPRSSVSVTADTARGKGQDPDPQVAVQHVSSVTGVGANTPIEQISDWVTKIIVGATLTQLGKIPAAATTLFTAMAAGVGDRPSGPAFVGGLTVFSAIMGFVFGWLVTRTYMGWVIETVEARLPSRRSAAR